MPPEKTARYIFYSDQRVHIEIRIFILTASFALFNSISRDRHIRYIFLDRNVPSIAIISIFLLGNNFPDSFPLLSTNCQTKIFHPIKITNRRRVNVSVPLSFSPEIDRSTGYPNFQDTQVPPNYAFHPLSSESDIELSSNFNHRHFRARWHVLLVIVRNRSIRTSGSFGVDKQNCDIFPMSNIWTFFLRKLFENVKLIFK